MHIKKTHFSRLILLCALLAVGGCSNATNNDDEIVVDAESSQPSEQPVPQGATNRALVQCTDPRPQICTREYNPVCATLEDGSVKTYATGCTACSDQQVTGYRQGSCE